MPYVANYPDTVQEILRDNKKYKPDCLRAMKRFRRAKAWRGSLTERGAKFETLHRELCEVYGLNTTLRFGILNDSSSGGSYFNPADDSITLSGRLSVVTYLHEFGHARGYDERKACIFSVNLFRRIFPRSFERATFNGHMVIQNNPTTP